MSSFLEIPSKQKIVTILQNWDEFKHRVIKTLKNENFLKNKNYKDYDQKVILEKYYSRYGQRGVKVSYKRPKYCKTGREFVTEGVGLQAFAKPIRHTICNGIYKDVDVKNCHPVLLLQICKNKDYPCAKIEKYINNRDTYLRDICDVNNLEFNKTNKEMAKKVILSIINGSIYNDASVIKKLEHKPLWFDAFKEECNNIKLKIYKDDNYTELRKIVNKKACESNKAINLEGSLLNHILCEIEDIILQSCIEYCKIKQIKWRNISKQFDGFMILKNEDINLTDLSNFVKLHTSYDVEYAYKEFDEVIDLSGLTCDIKQEENIFNDEGIIIRDDYQGAKILINSIKDDIKIGLSHIYLRDGFIWITDMERIRNILSIKTMLLNMCLTNKEGDIRPYSTNKTGCEKIVDTALIILKQEANPKNDELFFYSSLGKTCFKNGVYDWKTKKFSPWESIDNVYTTIIINRDYTDRNETKIKDVYKKIFHSCFEDQHEDELKDLLGAYANALGGNINNKYSILNLGSRNSGKGVFTETLCKAFEDYVKTIDSSVLLMDTSIDEIRNLGYFIDMAYSRLVICNEAKVDSRRQNKCIYDGNTFKKLQGGDELTGRKIREDKQKFRIAFKFVMNFNEYPTFEPNDCLQACENYSFPFRFVDKTLVNEIPEMYRQKDETIKDYIRNDDVANAVFHILTDYYSNERKLCAKSIQSNNEVCETTGDLEMILKNNIEKIDDNICLTLDSILIMLNGKDVRPSKIKLKKDMERLYPNKYFTQKINDKTKKRETGFFGLQIKEDD